MAPTTRSKASDGVPPAPLAKAAGGKGKKAKTAKRPAATKPEATTSKVQKNKKSGPKNKKQKGKSRTSSAATSAKSLSKASSKSSRKASPRKSTSKSPRPTARASAQDDFPELAQAISILPFLDQDGLRPPSTPRTPLLRTDHVLRPDHGVLMDQLAHHMVNPPAWSNSRPGTGSSSSKVSGFGGYLPRGFELAESPPLTSTSASQRDRSGSGSPHVHVHGPAYDRRRREPSGGSKRSGSSVVRDTVSQVEGQSRESETPVSVKNAHVFKRPTVADVRRERTLMHDELRDWTGRLRRARDDFDAVIEEIESRMQIIRAVNKMQAPLKKAPLGRGR